MVMLDVSESVIGWPQWSTVRLLLPPPPLTIHSAHLYETKYHSLLFYRFT